jgi:hypothetical protein
MFIIIWRYAINNEESGPGPASWAQEVSALAEQSDQTILA